MEPEPRSAAPKVEATDPPHPGWTPGVRQPNPAGPRVVQLDPAEMASCYPLVISGIVPRPIALVSSVSADGVGNVAPFSYFGAMGHDPPTVAIGFCRKGAGGSKKDSWANVEATKEFVVHIMSEWFVEAANHTCGNFLPEEDEMQIAGLTPVPSVRVSPPRIEESAFAMECVLRHSYDTHNRAGDVTGTVAIAEVVLFHVSEALYDPAGKGSVRFDGFAPLSRLGGNTYGRTTSTFDLPRPDRAGRNIFGTPGQQGPAPSAAK